MKSIYAIDFDGTIVTHEYPNIGRPVPYAIECMKLLQIGGAQLILWTMRSGQPLKEAVDYIEAAGVQLWGVNENPEQGEWTDSPKAYALHYIDDAALGCPLIRPADGTRPYVDWPELFPGIKLVDYDPAACRACSHIQPAMARALSLLTCRECGRPFP